MKIFPKFNTTGPACPVCKTTKDAECVLLPIVGKSDDNMTYEAAAVHVECLDLWFYEDDQIIAQALDH